MKKLDWNRIIPIALWVLQLVSKLVLLIAVWNLKMIPDGLYALACAGLAAVFAGTGLLMFLRGKKPVGNIRRWIAAALALLVTIGCAVGCVVVFKLQNTLDNIVTEEPDGVPVAIYVRVDDPAKSIVDAKDYTFASVTNYEVVRTQYVVADISRTVGKEISVKEYPSVFDMVDALWSDAVDAIILNPAYVDILCEMDGYTDFESKTRILCEVNTPEELGTGDPQDTEATEPSAETIEPVVRDITERTFVVYISGTDTTAKVFRTCRSDVNIIVVVNPVEKQVLLINTPRDYYVKNPAGNNARDKLTHCGMYGVDNSVKTLSNLYGIPIDYYARINFSGFEKMIDAVGGITVYSDASYLAVGKQQIVKGNNYLDGEGALLFARERYHVAGGDNGRGKNQMKVITALINKMTSSKTLISNYAGIMDSLGDMFTTSIPAQDLGKLVQMQLTDMPQWEIYSFAVTGENGRNETYSMPGRRLSVMYVDDDYVAHAAGLVNKMLSGEKITGLDLKMLKPQ